MELQALGNVTAEYRHQQKMVSPGEPLILPTTYLKWYDIYRPEKPISPQLAHASRQFVIGEAANLPIAHQLGFVLLHQCDTVIFLIVCAWCNTNELWKTVYYQPPESLDEYQLFEHGIHAPSFCVWEFGAACHESQAWSRYLASARDDAAKEAYLNDTLTGLV